MHHITIKGNIRLLADIKCCIFMSIPLIIQYPPVIHSHYSIKMAKEKKTIQDQED